MRRTISPELAELMDDELEMGAIHDLAAYMVSQAGYDYDAEWLNHTLGQGVKA